MARVKPHILRLKKMAASQKKAPVLKIQKKKLKKLKSKMKIKPPFVSGVPSNSKPQQSKITFESIEDKLKNVGQRLGRQAQQTNRLQREEIRRKIAERWHEYYRKQKPVEAPRQHKPRKLKPAQNCAKRTLRKRRQVVNKTKVSFDVDDRLPDAQSLSLKTEGNFTEEQYKCIRKVTPNVQPLGKVNKAKKKILNEYGSATNSIMNYKGEEFNIKYYSLLKILDFRLKLKPVNNQVIKIIFAGDCGGGVSKMGFYINNYADALSPYNFSILGDWIGQDHGPIISKLMEQIDFELNTLKFTNNILHYGQHRIKLFLTGDFKFLHGFEGLQPCSSKFRCLFCFSTSDVLNLTPRTLEHQFQLAQNVVERLPYIKSNSGKSNLMRLNFSTRTFPASKYIEFTHIAPPPEHVIAGFKAEIDEILQTLKLQRTKHSFEMTGPNARSFLKAVKSGKYNGKQKEFFLSLAKIEKFAVAEYLSPEKIEDARNAFEEFNEVCDNCGVDLSKCVKVHTLRYHVWPFIQRHGTWGLISEQSIEHLHNTTNKSHNRICNGSGKKNERQLDFGNGEHIVKNWNF